MDVDRGSSPLAAQHGRAAGGKVTPATQLPNRKPILDARTSLGLEQLTEAHEELEISIAWADRAEIGDNNPVIFGRRIRHLERLLGSALVNLTPGADTPVSVVASYAAETLRDMEASNRERAQLELETALPRQSRPAFANQAGAR